MSSPAESDPAADNTPIDAEELRRFTATFTRFMLEIHRLQPHDGGEARERVMAHLGLDPADVAPVGQEMPPVDRPNLQLAMGHLMARDPGAEDRRLDIHRPDGALHVTDWPDRVRRGPRADDPVEAEGP